MTDLFELTFPRSGKRSKVLLQKRRNMNPSDLATLSNGKPLEQVSPIASIRHQHHLLARLLADGKSLTESAEITGYSVTYISRLKTQDRAFQELITYYAQQSQEIYFSVHERLKGLGLNTIEELQERLAQEPDDFSNRELFELAELCLDRSGFGPTHNIKATHTVLTPDMISSLKEAIARKASGTIREISSSGAGAYEGPPLIEGSISTSKAESVQSEGNDLSAEGRKILEKRDPV